jgi:hypothetical protein
LGKVFYVVHHDGETTSAHSMERAMELTHNAKDWFVCGVSNGRVLLCGHSIGAMDDYENKCKYAAIKRHFVR